MENIYIDVRKIKERSREYYYLQRTIGSWVEGNYVYFDKSLKGSMMKKLALTSKIKEGTIEVSFEEFRLKFREQEPLFALLEEGDCIKYGNEYFTSVEYIYKVSPYFSTTFHRKTSYHKVNKYEEIPNFDWGARNAKFAFDGLNGKFITKKEFDSFEHTFKKQDPDFKTLNRIGKTKVLDWLHNINSLYKYE